MDDKKKLAAAYMPDKKDQKDKVIIGLSGSVDSFVAAYLLKIQKYELFAVTIINQWDSWDKNNSEILACHIDQAKQDKIKEFCQQLNIPVSFIKANEFKEEVIEPWMSDKISGSFSTACWNCHSLRMRILHHKMKSVGAKYLATGHFAKLFHQDGAGVFVHTSNDELNDQSSLLSRIPNHILHNLLLPLSDLTKKEVIKLSENFGVIDQEKVVKTHQCLSWKPEMKDIFEKNIPPKFMKGGDMISEAGNSLGQFESVCEMSYGEPAEFRDVGKTIKTYMSSYSYQDNQIKFSDKKFFTRNKLLITNCLFSLGTSWMEPLRGFVTKLDKTVECWIYPKSLSSVYLELEEPLFVKEGEVLTITKKKGKNAKIYLTGEVNFLPLVPEIEEGELNEDKADYSRDF